MYKLCKYQCQQTELMDDADTIRMTPNDGNSSF